MRKTKVTSSGHMIPKKRRHLQEYFDCSHNNVVTPNQRSLPKYKNIFNGHKNNKSGKKDHISGKRPSTGKVHHQAKK